MRKLLFVGLIAALLLLVLSSLVVMAQGEDLSSDQCKMCHAEQYEVWNASMHGESIMTEQIPDLRADTCLECHSIDYRLAPEDAKPTLETVQYGITCVLCHAKHETPGDEKPKVDDVYALCTECHNSHLEGAEMEPGDTAHHSMQEMFEGRGAIGVASIPSAHLGVTSCATCHQDGHNYKAAAEACDTCHAGAITEEEVTAEVGAELEALGAKLEAVKAALGEWETAETDEQKAWDKAHTNYSLVDADASKGAHNYAYAKAALESAEASLATIEVTPAELPTTGGVIVPSALPFIVSGVSLLALGASAAYIGRRKR